MLEDKNIRFIHVPKTGGFSVARVLFGTEAITGHRPVWRCPPPLTPHQTAVAFVRNPWDRLVSVYAYLQNDGRNARDMADAARYVKPHKGGFADFVRDLHANPTFYFQQQHLRPQLYYLQRPGCKQVYSRIDWLCRFERFETEMIRLCRAFRRPYTATKLNSNEHEPYQSYYDAETAQLVAEAYYTDFQAFGYSTEWTG
jgi:hypothetical protein